LRERQSITVQKEKKRKTFRRGWQNNVEKEIYEKKKVILKTKKKNRKNKHKLLKKREKKITFAPEISKL